MTAEVEACSNRFIKAPSAMSFLVRDGSVSTNSFVGTNDDDKFDWATKATGALGTDGVAGFRGIEGDTCGVSLR